MEIGFQRTHEFEVSKEKYLNFLKLSEDHNPMHVNDEFAIKHGFKEKVVHGNILNAFLSFMIGETLPIKNVVIIDQSIKYKSPVYIGMTIRTTLVVTENIDAVQVTQFKVLFEETLTQKKLATGTISIQKK